MLAELFLGGGSFERSPAPVVVPPLRLAREASPAPESKPSTPVLELIVPCHTPAVPSAWVLQAAREIAAGRSGPAGLVRIAGSSVRLDIVGPGVATLPRARSLPEGVAAAATRVDHWFLHAGDHDVPALVAGVDRVTLLTGADEAAVVACYRMIKEIHAAQRQEGRLPRLRAVIVGAGAAQARDAAGRLARAAGAFLGEELEVLCGPASLGAAPACLVYEGSWAATPEEMMTLIRRGDGAAGRAEAGGPPEPRAKNTSQDFSLVLEQLVGPELDAFPPSPRESEPKPAAPAPRSSAAPRPTLCELIGSLRPLRSVCPHAAHVELAADQGGVVHALVDEEKAGEHGALRDLWAVAAWARRHATLLSAAEGGTPIRDQEPVLHVFVRRPKGWKGVLDSGLRVHALVEGPQGRVCLDLN